MAETNMFGMAVKEAKKGKKKAVAKSVGKKLKAAVRGSEVMDM